jgi:hypothetical protein
VGVWNHLAVVFDGGLAKLYFNGNLVAESPVQASVLDYQFYAAGNSTASNYLGATHPVSPGITNFFRGKIDDFAVWHRPLSASEILSIYLGAAPVLGCTDVLACNYDYSANLDDGLCTYPGCSDPAACNYDEGSCPGGPCEYASDVISDWTQEVFGDFTFCQESGYRVMAGTNLYNPGTPNPWPSPSLAEAGAMSLGSFGALQQFSLAFKVNPDPVQNGISVLFDASHGGGINWVMQYFVGNGLWNFNGVDFELLPGIWQDVLITYSAGQVNIFRNGELIAQGFRILQYSGWPAWYMGNWPEGGRRFHGYVDDVLLSHELLNVDQVELGTSAPGAVQFLDFEDNAGGFAIDVITQQALPLNGWGFNEDTSLGLPLGMYFSGDLTEDGWFYPSADEIVEISYLSESCSGSTEAMFVALPSGCSDELACNFSPNSVCANSCVYPALSADCGAGAAFCGEGMVWDAAQQTCLIDPAYVAGIAAGAAQGACGPWTVWDAGAGQCVGAAPPACASDLSGNGSIGIEDLLILLSEFAMMCP